MTLLQQRQYDRFGRSISFLDKRKKDFAPNAKALTLRDELKGIVEEFDNATKKKKPTVAAPRSTSSAKLASLNALREILVRISLTAGVIASTNPKFKNTFALPDRRRKDDLVATARRFIKDATPVKAEFTDLEMDEDFLEELQSRINAYEAAQQSQEKPVAPRAASNDEVSNVVAQGAKVVDVLDIVLGNKYAKNPTVLQEWKAACHLEFTPRHRNADKVDKTASTK